MKKIRPKLKYVQELYTANYKTVKREIKEDIIDWRDIPVILTEII